MTSGLFCTSNGVPSAIFWPKLSTVMVSNAHHQAHVMFDQQDRELEVVAEAAQ
jgi:hypothetical protein